MKVRYKLAPLILLEIGLLFILALSFTSIKKSHARLRPHHQNQITEFLQPPYYGSVGCSSVYDHEYPRFSKESEGFNPAEAFIITSTVVHYDGIRHWGASYSGHNGIDYLLRYSVVRAAAPGQIIYAGWDTPGDHTEGIGLYVHMRHDNDYDTLYGHMSVLRVRTNEEIQASNEFQRILGISGNTGNSSGAHLHFELEAPGSSTSVNPYGWIGTTTDPWESWSGLTSHNVWLYYPSITDEEFYPSDDPLSAPPINFNEGQFFTIDDGDPSFNETPDCWTIDNTDGWDNDYRHRNVPGDQCTATWTFSQEQFPGKYNIFVHIPSNNATVDGARYTIRHTTSASRPWEKQEDIAIVNQLAYPESLYHPSSWVYIGTYYFFSDQYDADYVRLESEPLSATGTLAADAVRFASIIYRNYLPSTTKRSPPIPYKPALNPIDNLHHQSNYLVDWLPVDLADTYTLQEANDPDFNETITQYSGTSYSWSAIDKTINTYYYRVKASNLWGDSSWSDIQHTTVLPPTGWQTITSQNFESTFPDKWRAFDNNGSSNGEYYWGSRTCKPYNDNYSGWGIGGGTDGEDLTCGSNYPHNLDSWLIYGPFNLENAIASELTFKLWLYSESENDWAFHGASKNGINFYSYATSGNTQGWVNKNLDLANIPTLGNLLGEPEIWITLIFHWTLAFFDFATICCVRTSCLTTTGGTDF